MKFPVFVPLLLISGQAFAMPCDSSYLCTSARGKYKIDIQRCRYDNRLGNIGMLQIGGKDVTGATLGPAFDGDDFGAFEIDLPQQGDTQRILSVEWQKKTRTGTIRDKSRSENPGPYHSNFSSAITCKIQG